MNNIPTTTPSKIIANLFHTNWDKWDHLYKLLIVAKELKVFLFLWRNEGKIIVEAQRCEVIIIKTKIWQNNFEVVLHIRIKGWSNKTARGCYSKKRKRWRGIRKYDIFNECRNLSWDFIVQKKKKKLISQRCWKN